MNETPLAELLRYRMDRASATIEEAVLLLDKQHVASAVNRLYYACYYAASALLLKSGLSFRRHSGLLSAFNREFVKTGTVKVETGAVFAKLFSQRQRADYDDLPEFQSAQVDDWIIEVRSFVATINALLGD